MTPRFATWLTVLMALAVGLAFSPAAWAAVKTHDGKVVSVTEGKAGADGKLVMTDSKDKNEHSHMISSSVKITLNGKTAKLTDLKKGDAIKVTADADSVVTAVAATRK